MGKIDNAISTINQTKAKFVNYATTHKEKLGKAVIDTILLVIIFAVFGCFDFVTFTFRFEAILEASFWAKVISKAIAGGICAYNIGLNLSWDREIEKDEILAEQTDKYARLIRTKDQKTFEYFVTKVFNPKQKKEAYISQINRKLYLLNKFSTNKSKLLWDAYSEDKAENEALEKQKAKNRYCVKRKELEYLKTDEYIDKNLDSLKVNYSRVDPLVFDLEIDGKATYKGVKVKGNVAGGKVRATTNVLMGMFAVSMFLTVIGLDANQQQFENQMVAFWHYLLTCVEDVGIIVWQTLRGILGSPKIISAEITQPFIGRNKVLTDYNEWCVENKIEKSKSYLMYQKIIEEENRQREVA